MLFPVVFDTFHCIGFITLLSSDQFVVIILADTSYYVYDFSVSYNGFD
jgi:hypothetical protein